MQNIKMSWFRYAHDGHPRDKKVGISKNASMFLFTIFYLFDGPIWDCSRIGWVKGGGGGRKAPSS